MNRRLPDWLRPDNESGKTTTAHFRSWGDWVDHCENGKSKIPTHDRASRRPGNRHGCYLCKPEKYEKGDPDPGFTGSANFPEALQQARGKADNGLNKMREYLDVMNAAIGQRIMQPTYYLGEEGGGEIDMGAFMTGQPEIYMTPREAWAQAPSTETAHIFFHMGYSGLTSEDVIATRGAVALALVSLLEQGGVPTRLTAAVGKRGRSSRTSGNDCKHAVTIDLKGYGVPLDLPTCAYAFANPGANRRLAWSHYEQLPSEERSAFHIGGNYGSPANAHTIPEDCIVFHHGKYNDMWKNPETAQKWLEELLTSKGVELMKG